MIAPLAKSPSEGVIRAEWGKAHWQMVQAVATQWLDAWGAVIQERSVTGDASAIPKGAFAVVGGNRGFSSGIPSIIDAYLDVDEVLGRSKPGVRQLVKFVHVDSTRIETIAIRFHFANCTSITLDIEEARARPPVGWVTADPKVRRIEEVNWSTFAVAHQFGDLTKFGCSVEEFLKWRLDQFRKRLIDDKGLREIASRYLISGVRPKVFGEDEDF